MVGLNWVVVTGVGLSGVREGVVSCIIAHDIDEVKMVTSCLEWIHPHATVGAFWLGIGILTVIIGTYREGSGCKDDFLILLSIERLNCITKVFDQIGQDSIG